MKGILRAIAIAAALVVAVAWNAQAVSLHLDPGSFTVSPGGTYSVDLVATDLGIEVVTTFDVDIGYDNSLLQFVDYTLGDGLGVPDPFWGTSAEAWDLSLGASGGIVKVGELSFLSAGELADLQSDPLVLATLDFSSLLQTGDQPVDTELWIEDQVVGTEVVPEPGTLLLLGSGLLGVAGWRRRRS